MKDLTPLLLGAGLVYFLLQAQKTQKSGGDTFVDRRTIAGGAKTRTGRMVDNAQAFLTDAQRWSCDTLPHAMLPWDCSA